MSDPPIEWAKATIKWTQEGDTLSAPLLLNDRAAHYLHQAMPDLIGGSFSWGVQGANDTDGSRGLLSISSADLLDADGVALRIKLQVAAQEAGDRAAEDQAADDKRAAVLLAALRNEE